MFKIYFGVFGEGTRLAMPKTICVPDSSSLKPGSGATEGVLDLGVLGQPDYMRMPDKIEDFVPCPDGSLLCVEGKLDDSVMNIPFSVTDSV